MYFINDRQAAAFARLIRTMDTNYVTYLEYVTFLTEELCITEEGTNIPDRESYDLLWWKTFSTHPYVFDFNYLEVVERMRKLVRN